MRFISADFVFPVSSPAIPGGIVVVHEDGLIEDVLKPSQLSANDPKIEKLNGVLCPGFINAHCHLELSHLKGKLPEGKGLPHFIGSVITQREASKEVIAEHIAKAEQEMISNGIVAVGDICNTPDTIPQKKKNNIRYHNFIELFDLMGKYLEQELTKGESLLQQYNETDHSSSLTPHAPYSVSETLFAEIQKRSNLLSIHNQETPSEDEMFLHHSGAMYDQLHSFVAEYNDWQAPGTTSLQYTLKNISAKTLLVHNTYTIESDLHQPISTPRPSTESADQHISTSAHQHISLCLCPNANLYIENRLPDIPALMQSGLPIVLGTDSYASNWSLSIFDEMSTIAKHYPEITFETMLQWSTLNAAKFFGWDSTLGSIEKGKRPGLNLIDSDRKISTIVFK